MNRSLCKNDFFCLFQERQTQSMKLPDLAIIWKNVQVLDKLEEMFFPESRGTYGIVQHFLNNKKLERKKRKQKSKEQKKKTT